MLTAAVWRAETADREADSQQFISFSNLPTTAIITDQFISAI